MDFTHETQADFARPCPVSRSASRFQRIAMVALNCAIFALTASAVCLLIHPQLPIPAVPEVQAKLEWLKAHPDEYDTLFIGTSRIYRQIMPRLFDQLMAEKGIPTKSFNVAVDGMRPPEDAYFFDQILKFHPKGLRYVFLELDSVRVPVDPLKRGTSRNVYWHDWERLSVLFHAALEVKKTPRHLRGWIKALSEPMGDFAEHAGLFVENMSNYGRSGVIFEHLAHLTGPLVYRKTLGPDGDGFLEIEGRKEMKGKDLAKFEGLFAERQQSPAVEDDGNTTDRASLHEMLQKTEALGAKPVLIIPPTLALKNFCPPPGSEPGVAVLNFSSQQKYPMLYDEEVRLDTDHLNTAGAELFTRMVAERFAELELGKK
jgi:hypothetical protein